MSMAERPAPVLQRGPWPRPVRLRRGWARADARRWNDVVPDAALRLVRGGARFLDDCTRLLNSLGAPCVLSPPLSAGNRRPWEEAGFTEFAVLAFLRLDLTGSLRTPDHLVVSTTRAPVDAMLRIDRAAFDSFWRLDEHGLREAIGATRRAGTLLVRDGDGDPVAFAVVGYSHAVSYLQRLAVHPDWQGRGIGRSLLRAAARSARDAGSRALMLNTQIDNAAAESLYASEGFETLPEPLAVLRRS